MIQALLSIDHYVLEHLFAIRTVPGAIFFLSVTEIGRSVIVIGIMLAVSLWLGLKKRYADIAGLFTAVLGSATYILALKFIINRPRPILIYQAYAEGPYHSFPSAHAGLAMALYGFLTYLLIQTYPTKLRQIATAILPILIVLVGFSRLYLGVHYLSDVLVGFAIGALFVWLGAEIRLYVLRLLDARR